MIFSRLASLGLHKLDEHKAGNEAAGSEQLEISRVLGRVMTEGLRASEAGQSEQIAGLSDVLEHEDEIDRLHPDRASARDEALELLRRHGVLLI